MNITSEVKGAPKHRFATKDLHQGDGQRVTNLIKEFARFKGEKDNVLPLLTAQRTHYEDQLRDQLRELAAERQKMELEHEEFRLQLKENQKTIDKYQKIVKELREKRDRENLADQVQMEGVEERRKLISNNLLNFYTPASLEETRIKALDQFSTDFKCNQPTGDQGGQLYGMQKLDEMVSSTRPSLTDFSNFNPLMTSEDTPKIMTAKTSDRPILSDTQSGKYDENDFTLGSHESRNPFRSVFSDDGTSLLSSDVENTSVRNSKMAPTSGHVTDELIGASKLGESGVQQLSHCQNTKAERRNLLLPDHKNQYVGRLYDERQCVEEVLRSQKNQEQGHWSPYDTECPRAKGKSSASLEHLAGRTESKKLSKFPLEMKRESSAGLQRRGHDADRATVHSDNSSTSLASFSNFKDNGGNPVHRLKRNESDSSLEESEIIDNLFFLT